jgi:hypothetical protein
MLTIALENTMLEMAVRAGARAQQVRAVAKAARDAEVEGIRPVSQPYPTAAHKLVGSDYIFWQEYRLFGIEKSGRTTTSSPHYQHGCSFPEPPEPTQFTAAGGDWE